MINEQLTDFIIQESKKGISKDVISKELLSGDWTQRDIEEGFNAIGVKNTTSDIVSDTVIAPTLAQAVNPIIAPVKVEKVVNQTPIQSESSIAKIPVVEENVVSQTPFQIEQAKMQALSSSYFEMLKEVPNFLAQELGVERSSLVSGSSVHEVTTQTIDSNTRVAAFDPRKHHMVSADLRSMRKVLFRVPPKGDEPT